MLLRGIKARLRPRGRCVRWQRGDFYVYRSDVEYLARPSYSDGVAFVTFYRSLWGPPVGMGRTSEDYLRDSEGRVMAKSAGELLASVLKRTVEDKSILQSVCPTLREQCETAHALMTERLNHDGKPRQVCTLLIFADEGMWKGCLSERDHGLVLWATGDSVPDMLVNLEERLNADTVDWRVKQPIGGLKRK